MKTADLVADHRTDALVALAQVWELCQDNNDSNRMFWKMARIFGGATPHMTIWVDNYSPSTNPAQCFELIEVFCLSIDQLISGAHNIHVNGYGWVNGADENLKLAICKAVITA